MQVRVIRLDTRWTECGLCRKDIPLCSGGFALPMYEGKMDWSSEIYFAVCKDCYMQAMELMPAGATIVTEDDGYPD